MFWNSKTLFMLPLFFIMSNKSPMAILLSTLALCTSASSAIFMMWKSPWSSILLLMAIVSGIMVVFMYAISLTPNEKTTKKTVIPLTMIWIVSMVSPLSNNIYPSSSMSKTYQTNPSLMLLMTMVVFLSALIPTKAIMSMFKGMKTSK